MSGLGKIAKGFAFVVTGIVTIIVGFFMLRGNLRMWERKDSKNTDSDP